MNSVVYFALFFVCSGAQAQVSGGGSSDKACGSNPISKLAEICDYISKDDGGIGELKALAAKDGDIKASDFSVVPTSRTCSSVTYSFPGDGKKLDPNHALYLAVPKDLRSRSAATLLLNHRQDPNYGDNKALYEEEQRTGQRPRDSSPGLTSFQVHQKDSVSKEAWRHYQASWGASGPGGAKFAEIGYRAERETMEGLRSHGHKGVHSGDISKEPLHVNAMRLVNTGKDPVMVSGATLKLAPPKSDKIIEAIFTDGTAFENYETGKAATYGGGEGHSGKYKEALRLPGSTDGDVKKLPKGWKIKDGELRIALDKGYHIGGIEVAVGDMHDDGKQNKDGGIGSSGGASLSIALMKNSGDSLPLMASENVGKNDIMTGFPADCGYVSQAGDELVIRSTGDTAHIMGVRLSLQKKVSP